MLLKCVEILHFGLNYASASALEYWDLVVKSFWYLGSVFVVWDAVLDNETELCVFEVGAVKEGLAGEGDLNIPENMNLHF